MKDYYIVKISEYPHSTKLYDIIVVYADKETIKEEYYGRVLSIRKTTLKKYKNAATVL